MSLERTVDEKHLRLCMAKIRELRAMSVNRKISPWVVRQALLIAIAIDTHVAIKRGIPLQSLKEVDTMVAEDVEKWIQKVEG